jgi:seryl-tRNA synthetase
MVIAVEHNSIKTKHLKSTLDSKINSFYENIQNFNHVISNQKEILNSLQNKMVSYLDISKELLKVKENDESNIENKMLKVKAFSRKLLTSITDRLENLNVGQIEILNNTNLILKNNLTDIEIPAHKAFNNYIEVYRSFDSTILKRETDRILSIIN